MLSCLQQIRRQLGLNQSDLAKILKCSKSNISTIETGKSPLPEGYKALLVQFLDINYSWFDNPEAPMFVETHESAAGPDDANAPAGGIPVYNIGKIRGLSNLLNRVRRPKATGYITVPGMPRCDGAVRVTGEGMYPLLRSGDLVVYRNTNSLSEIFWGEMYLVSIETSAGEYIAVRYIRKSQHEGRALLSGENPAFSDTEIELSKINALALVKATIRFNTSK